MEKISIFPELLFFFIYFATITRSHTPRGYTWLATCWRTAQRRRCRETRMWLVLRFSCARRERGWRTEIGFGVGMTRREERRMSRLSQASLFGFSPSRDLPTFLATRSKLIAFPRITALISSLSGYFILLPRGRSPRVGGAPTRVYPLSSRNNKLTLLNLSWAAFRSSSLRQQRAPAYLPTNIVTAFNSVIYLMLHAF